jgi:hypothetical protein
VKETAGFMVYPIVDLDVPDFEEAARAYCAQHGWEFIALVAQQQTAERHVQLRVKATVQDAGGVVTGEPEVEVEDCGDPNCSGGISWHVESEHAPDCDCGSGSSSGSYEPTTCPVPVQVQHECPWPGHRMTQPQEVST